MPEPLLRVARVLPRSSVNGPGERFVIWVQGCPFRCKGCFNPDLLAFCPEPPVAQVPVDRLLDRILEEHARRPLDGVTFSGGEPFAHAESGLADLAERIRQAGLTLVVFTGYEHQALQRRVEQGRSPGLGRLLAATDLLVAGPYRQDRPAHGEVLRGSTNQEVVPLSGRLQPPGAATPRVEMQISAAGELVLTGLPDPRVRAGLRAMGFETWRPAPRPGDGSLFHGAPHGR